MSDNLHRGSHVKLRKSRRCEWCAENIEKGADAYRGQGRFDGSFYDYRMHPECAEAMNNDPDIAQEGFMPLENERPRIEDQPQ
jgi:hypothetical protein